MKQNKGTGKDEETRTPRRTFSVSKEFEYILSEIDSMPNMSRFVCEAIHEKIQRVKNPNKELQEALAHFVQIQQVIGGQQPASPAPQVTAQSESLQQVARAVNTTPPVTSSQVEPKETEQVASVKKPSPSVTPSNQDEPEIMVEKRDETESKSTSEDATENHDNTDVSETSSPEKEEEQGVLSELQKNFLKPRASR